MFGEALEIRFLDVIQKSSNALINRTAIRPLFEFGVEEFAQLENNGKAILDDGKRRASFRRGAPGEIEKYPSISHSHFSTVILSRRLACRINAWKSSGIDRAELR